LHGERSVLSAFEPKVGRTFKVVAVLPEPVSEARDYLKREGVHIDQLRQMSLDEIGVSGTPTMLLLNNSGIVMETWVGKLAPDEQEEAVKTILGVRSSAHGGRTTAVLEARR